MKSPAQNLRVTVSVLLWSALLLIPPFTGLGQATNLVLSLDGNGDYVSIPSASDLQNPIEITVEAWIYPTNTGASGYFLIKGDGGFVNSARSYELSWQPDNGGTIVFSVFLGTSTWGAVGALAMADRWVHVAGTYSSTDSVLRIYTNGFLVGETTNDASGTTPLNHQALRQTTLPLVFGAELTHPMGFIAGRMDEVRVWNKARNAQDIYANVFCRLSGTETNLSGYWNFDAGNASDLTGHGHNGTFAGNAQAVAIVGSDAVHAGECGAGRLAHTATAIAALVNGFVVGANITDGGYGYTNSPSIRIINGGGSGAQAVAVVSNGMVIAVNMVNAGTGYTNAPTVIIAPPFIAQPTMNIAALSLLSFTNLALGTNYQLQSLFGNTWSNIGQAFTAANSTFTQLVSGMGLTSGYRLVATPVPSQASATAQVVNGFVVGATMTSAGSGYTTNPAVTFTGGGGTNATGASSVSGGSVTGITITSAGIGYTNSPTITIGPPAATGLGPKVTQVMKLDVGRLSPYDNYQLEFTPVAGGTWSSLGTFFTPIAVTNTQNIDVTGNAGFFRVRTGQ